MIKNSIEYNLIKNHYRTKVANRSQVPLINHIDEGLMILDSIAASDWVKQAFCIHPLLQTDFDLVKNYNIVSETCCTEAVLYAMEYRSVANEYLSDKIDTNQPLRISPLSGVQHMLIADKVQNYKDFLTYHKHTHPRSEQLERYFEKWLIALDVGKEAFVMWSSMINSSRELKVMPMEDYR